MKITPVLVVEEIEPCLPFWVDRLGFQNVAQVPEGDSLGFVILVRDEGSGLDKERKRAAEAVIERTRTLAAIEATRRHAVASPVDESIATSSRRLIFLKRVCG